MARMAIARRAAECQSRLFHSRFALIIATLNTGCPYLLIAGSQAPPLGPPDTTRGEQAAKLLKRQDIDAVLRTQDQPLWIDDEQALVLFLREQVDHMCIAVQRPQPGAFPRAAGAHQKKTLLGRGEDPLEVGCIVRRHFTPHFDGKIYSCDKIVKLQLVQAKAWWRSSR